MNAPAQPLPSPEKTRTALLWYRIAAYVVGVGLVVLVFVGVPMKYFGDSDTIVAVVGPLHGFLYVVYLLTVANLGLPRRWPLPRLVGVALAGTIPLLSFVIERLVHRRVTAGGNGW